MKQRKKKSKPEDQIGIKWLLFGVLCFVALLIVVSVIDASKKNPYESACRDFCEDKRGERYAYYGFRQPCGSNDWRACMICFCHVDDMSKQVAPYVLQSGDLYTELLREA